MAARRIVEEVKGVREAYVRVLSRIGRPIDEPQIASAALVLDNGTTMSAVRGDVESIMDESLSDIKRVTGLILRKKLILF